MIGKGNRLQQDSLTHRLHTNKFTKKLVMWCAQAQYLLPKPISSWLAAELDQSLGKHFLVFVLEHHKRLCLCSNFFLSSKVLSPASTAPIHMVKSTQFIKDKSSTALVC